jgi:hypothetical protein
MTAHPTTAFPDAPADPGRRAVVGEDDGLVELSDVIGVVRDELIAARIAGRWPGRCVFGSYPYDGS